MPRNSSGTYALYTPGNPVVTSTVISSTWANNTLADLASALTDSLSRTGDGGMQAPLELDDGAIGAPGLTWATDTTSGLYRNGAADFRFSVSATDAIAFSTFGARLSNGLVGSPSLAFMSDTNTGLYRIGADNLGIACNGAKVLDIATTGLGVTGALTATTTITPTTAFRAPDGLVGTPSYSFTNSTGTGLYSTGANILAFASAGVLRGSVNATGNWTIAAPSSGAALAITGLVSTNLFTVSDGTVTVATQTSASAGFIGTTSAHSFSLVVGNSTKFSFNTNGQLLSLGAGTNSLPSYSWNGDPDTGFYQTSSGNNDIAMALGSTSYLVGYRQIPRSTTATTFAIGDVGKCVAVSAAINIPISVFAAGDAISVYNDSGSAVNITISAGTLRLAGTTTTGTRSLNARGLCTLWFNVGGATPEVIASGSVS
jgi:hypothetical protein